jgi:UDP-glucose 4-epimerase
MHYLVTGAAGFIGAALVEHLQSAGENVLAVTRRGDHGVDFSCENVPGAWLEGADAVVHCAGIAHTRAAESDYRRVNCEAVLELAARAEAAGVRVFIFLSSVRAERAVDAYGRSKRDAEQALESAFEHSGLSVVILRPSLVYGPGVKANLAALISAVRRGLPAPPAGGARSLVDRDDLCELIAALSRLAPEGVHRFTVTDGEAYDLQRVYRAVRSALGRAERRPWLPLGAWWLACRLRDLVHPPGAGDSTYARLFGQETHDCDVQLPGLEWRPRHTLESRLPEMIAP